MLRILGIGLIGIGFWLGMQSERALMKDRCLDAGGRVGAMGLCEGIPAQ